MNHTWPFDGMREASAQSIGGARPYCTASAMPTMCSSVDGLRRLIVRPAYTTPAISMKPVRHAEPRHFGKQLSMPSSSPRIASAPGMHRMFWPQRPECHCTMPYMKTNLMLSKSGERADACT